MFSAVGLKSFVSAAKKLPSSDVYDVVEGYIKISMECAEIFKLLEGEKRVDTEVIRNTFVDFLVRHVYDRALYKLNFEIKKIYFLLPVDPDF